MYYEKLIVPHHHHPCVLTLHIFQSLTSWSKFYWKSFKTGTVSIVLQWKLFLACTGTMGLLPDAQNCGLRVSGMPGTFSPLPRFSDPDMHHGKCVAHMQLCMPGSLTSGFLRSRWRGKHSRRMRKPQFCVSGKRPMEPVWLERGSLGNAHWHIIHHTFPWLRSYSIMFIFHIVNGHLPGETTPVSDRFSGFHWRSTQLNACAIFRNPLGVII